MCSPTASLSLVRGLTNWFSNHLGACVQFAMVYPAEKNWNQIWSTEFLWHILPICSKAPMLDLGISLWQGLSHEYQRGKITDNCFGWKWLFFPNACWLSMLIFNLDQWYQSQGQRKKTTLLITSVKNSVQSLTYFTAELKKWPLLSWKPCWCPTWFGCIFSPLLLFTPGGFIKQIKTW